MAENYDASDEVELDFTQLDRMNEHLAEGTHSPDDEVEIPAWFETDEKLVDLYAEASMKKALSLALRGKVTLVREPYLYDVEGSELYTCNVIEFEGSDSVPGITCTCPNGSNRSGRPTCYHSAAVLLVHMKVDLEEFAEEHFPEQ